VQGGRERGEKEVNGWEGTRGEGWKGSELEGSGGGPCVSVNFP